MKVLWSPEGRDSVMRRFAERNGFDDYEDLQRWSVTDLEAFWTAVADFYGLRLDAEPRARGARDARRGVVPGRDAQLRASTCSTTPTTSR